MERKNVNPWTWQDAFGFSQACEVRGGERVLFGAGQLSVDTDGNPLHAGDMKAQVIQALDNVDAVLAKAEMSLSDVVRINYYTTDVQALVANFNIVGERLAKAGIQPASTVLGIKELARPEFMIEIEVTAVK